MVANWKTIAFSVALAFGWAVPASAQTACGVTATADVAGKISVGHSWSKHSAEFVAGKVIANLAMPATPKVTTTSEFKAHIVTVMGSATNKPLSNGRKAWWLASTGTIVIFDPNNVDCGTAFRPTLGKAYYDQQT